VLCAVQSETESGGIWRDTSCVCKLMEGVEVTDLLFSNQCFVLVNCLYIEGFPAVHACALMTTFNQVNK
jgi:hypothetical protein